MLKRINVSAGLHGVPDDFRHHYGRHCLRVVCGCVMMVLFHTEQKKYTRRLPCREDEAVLDAGLHLFLALPGLLHCRALHLGPGRLPLR